MYYFHLSYDNSKLNPKGIAQLLRDKFAVTQIGRPVESTMIFMMTGSDNDVERLCAELQKKFPGEEACFVVSRVSCALMADKKTYLDHIRAKAAKTHDEGLQKDIKSLNDDGTQSATLKNLMAPYNVKRF